MRASSKVDFENSASSCSDGAPTFYGTDLELPADLTILGNHALHEFGEWALKHGAVNIRRLTDLGEYATSDHALVAHDFGEPVSLDELGPLRERVTTLLPRAARLLLFVEIVDHCTIETVRRALRSEMPDLTFRIIYPRGVYEASGLRIFTVERRRPRIYLFASSHPMAGKTESALALAESGIRVVHVDGVVNGIIRGEVSATASVRARMLEMFDSSPLDHDLFAQLVAMFPEVDGKQDLIFDLLMPISKQHGLMDFFERRGFFPILCISHADRAQIANRMEQAEGAVGRLESEVVRLNSEVVRYNEQTPRLAAEVARVSQELIAARAQVDGYRSSTSWRVTAPLRFLSERLRSLRSRSDA